MCAAPRHIATFDPTGASATCGCLIEKSAPSAVLYLAAEDKSADVAASGGHRVAIVEEPHLIRLRGSEAKLLCLMF